MGTNINGWVEYGFTGRYPHPYSTDWFGIIKLGTIPDRNHDMFGCLFGVHNYAHFIPVAANRGIPFSASYEVREELQLIAEAKWRDEIHSYTWITWQEIKNIDWEEEGEELDSRVHVYEREENGELIWRRKGAYPVDNLTPEAWTALAAGQLWEQDGQIFKLEKTRRKEGLEHEEEWQLLFELMEVLAKRFGDEYVRMVVWFD